MRRAFVYIFYRIEGKPTVAKSKTNKERRKAVVASDDGNKTGILSKAKEWSVKLSSG